MSELAEVTTAEQWHRLAEGEWVIALPSRARVRVRRPDIGRLFAQGLITRDQLMTDANRAPREDRLQLGRVLAPHIVTQPPIAAEGSEIHEGWMPVASIPESDVLTILGWFMGRYSGEEREA